MSLSPGEPHAHQRYIFEWLPAIIEAGRRGPLKLIDTFMREKLLFRKFIRFKSRAGKESRENASCTGETQTGVKFEKWNLKFTSFDCFYGRRDATLYAAASFDLHIFPNQYLIRVIYTKRFRPEPNYRAKSWILNLTLKLQATSTQ